MKPTIILAQMGPRPGKPAANFATITSLVEAHATPGCIIAFPEMAIGGYLIGDLWLSTAWCRYLMEFNAKMAELSRIHKCTIIYGNVHLDETKTNKDGRPRKLNAAYIYDNGQPVLNGSPLPAGLVAKTLLPNYRFFDDERYFLSALDVATDLGDPLEDLIAPFTLPNGTTIGVQLCEDLWCADYRRKGKEINTAAILGSKGADVIINLSASPWTYGKAGARDRRIAHICSTLPHPIPYAYVNRTGVENCGDNIITFDGGSTIYTAKGERAISANTLGKNDIISFNLADQLAPEAPRPEPSMPAQKFHAVVAGLRHVSEILNIPEGNYPKFIIGVSGGMDSCLSLCFLVEAFGKENVTGVTMPSVFTSGKTLTNAQYITKALGVPLITAPIKEVVDAVHGALDLVLPGTAFNLENEQARIRGSDFLSGLAARMGALYTNNGNRLETALGYATLYGDVNGSVAPLADLLKTEILDISKFLNTEFYKREVIPTNLFPTQDWRYDQSGVAPSAELATGQIDPMKFGYHDALLDKVINYMHAAPEDILRWYLDGEIVTKLGITESLFQRWGLNDPKTFVTDLEWFFGLLRRNVFKRVQAPPIIITSKTAFGYDLREAMLTPEETTNYKNLKAQVLALATAPKKP